MFTITAIPSFAITVAFTPFLVSLSARSRDAIPISHVPSIAFVTPVVESLCCTSTVTSLFAFAYASFNFSITGVTDEDPPTTTLPFAPFDL